ncbi:SDR family NAD(P)-dependent oxidoreductase [Streptomyces sp. 891-h]|uniref:SDR family NAD(P)-dependent oxidoreductase n=1 Tax=Streptomyces sp. 891-h TaxID=2720714 RepID=UPI001FA9D241|nr:SDR family NAD(P)-dependent oxidoreductase [Streptomyces sp. 891-h]UNZ19249.1 SDR family oxidoreductase [Streptomyces sp. 891-h]
MTTGPQDAAPADSADSPSLAENAPAPTHPVYPDLAGKVAVVTGGSRGIGAETGRALAAQGVAVCLVGRDRPALFEVADGIGKAGGTAIGVVADVTDAGALDRVAERVAAELGPVDILATFAGGQGAPTPTQELTEERWRQVLDTDLTSAFLTIRAFLPGMVERFSGSILTMSSSAGRRPSQANLAYGVANAGLTMLTRQLATELGPQGIRVNCLAPTTVRTEKVVAHMPKELQHKAALRHPLRRLGEPSDVAAAAVFLASEAAGYLTGITLDVAGGRITD